jgi:lipopolysaccharide assembly LapA-like protein
MGRFLFFVVLLPLGIIAVALSVANREPVRLSLDPLGSLGPAWSLSLPLYALLFAVLAVGVVIGGIAAWLGQSKWRYAARAERANASRLRREVERLRELSGRSAIAPRFDRDAA